MSELEDEIRRRILAERSTERPQAPAERVEERPYYSPPPPPANPSFLQRKQQKGGVVGALAGLLLLLAKIGAPLFAILAKLKFLLIGLKLLTFGKVLLTFSSMLLSMWVYAHFYGWPFGVGMVLLIFIHECGHALAARLRGIPVTLMVFVPLLGAAVFRKRYGKNLAESAFISIMGPAVGTVGALACIAGYGVTRSHFWLALAEWGFLINLFNLVPFPALDGSKIVPLFSPKQQASSADRWRFGFAYFGLVAFLGAGYLLLRHMSTFIHPVLA